MASDVEHPVARRSHVRLRSATASRLARQLHPTPGNVAQSISASVSRRAYRTAEADSAGRRSVVIAPSRRDCRGGLGTPIALMVVRCRWRLGSRQKGGMGNDSSFYGLDGVGRFVFGDRWADLPTWFPQHTRTRGLDSARRVDAGKPRRRLRLGRRDDRGGDWVSGKTLWLIGNEETRRQSKTDPCRLGGWATLRLPSHVERAMDSSQRNIL